MTNERFDSEKTYYVMISIAKGMLDRQIITKAEYVKIDTMLIAKYHPILGGL
jgi:hypothetical protein